MAAFAFLSPYAEAQESYNLAPVVVQFDKGSFEFRNMQLVEFPGGSGLTAEPQIEGEIVNHTGTDWPNIEFLFHIKGVQFKRVPAPGAYIGKYGASEYVLVPDESKPVEYEVPLGFQNGVVGDHQDFTLYNIGEKGPLAAPIDAFELTGLEITLTKHVSREEVLQAEKQKREKEEAERRLAMQRAEQQRQAAAAQTESERSAALARAEARRRELAQFPKLVNGSESVPVAADEKCLEETIDAINKGGLEGRKKIPELLAYGCIFTVESKTPVRVVKKDWNNSFVTVMDGVHQGESGWVLSGWVQ